MSITKEQKIEIVKKFGNSASDTGSTEVQIGILTSRINNLSLHLKEHNHDSHSLRGLMVMVGARRRLLNYLKKKNLERYTNILQSLNLRK